MQILLFEGIAFFISVIAFIYGIFRIYIPKSPLYFNMIVSAVGCYVLEELWVIVNAMVGVENDVFSVRLIGVFGCFCTFLTANSKFLNITVDDSTRKFKLTDVLALIAPITFLSVFILYVALTFNEKFFLYIIISFVVVLPLIIDSYFEFKYIVTSSKEIQHLEYIKPINYMILMEYVLSFVYFFVESQNILLVLDVVYAVIMALLVFASRKGAVKWKTLM